MDLTSCKSCGTVLDKDHLHFPKEIYTDEGALDLNLATYNNRFGAWVAYVPCPICKEPILKKK